MPANHQKFFDMAAGERNNVPLLDNYLCRICKKIKPPQGYSNKELNDYRFKVGSGTSMTAYNSKLKCRACKGEQVHELECEGPCGLVKVLDEFSKAQRSRGGKWCKQCIAWKEAAEPGITTFAPPNANPAPDEQPNVYGIDDLEGDADSDYGDDFAPYMEMGTLSVVDGGSAGGNTDIQARDIGTAAPRNASITNIATSLASRPGQRQGTGKENSRMPSTSGSASNPYEARVQQQTASVASWSILDPRRRAMPAAKGPTFNAYDPSGQIHTQQRLPSSTAQTSSQRGPITMSQGSQQTPPSASRIPPRASGLNSGANAGLGAGPAAGPRPGLGANPAVRSNERNGWAKPVGRRVEAPKFPVSRPVVVQRKYDSESDDEM